jgi:hypothetical protein
MKQFYSFWFVISLFHSFVSSQCVFAQQGIIRGKVIDDSTKKAIEYVSVLNYSRHSRVFSNSTGEFSLEAHAGDTLVLYAVGYYYNKVIVDQDMIRNFNQQVFTMNQQAFEIAEVRIFNLGTYEEFKQRFVDLNRPITKRDILADELAEVSRQVAREAYEKAMAEQHLDGVSLLSVPILTPEEKERLVLAEIIKKEKVHDQVYQKFNPVVVKKVTGLTDDDRIIEFMVYCNYSDSYLLNVNDYDLMVDIVRKFEMFKKKKEAEKSMENHLCPDDPRYHSAA